LLIALSTALATVWACGQDETDAPRPELEGQVGGGDFGTSLSAGGASTVTTGGAGGTMMTSTGTGGTGAAGGGSCMDMLEPNDSEATAAFVANINDCDTNEMSIQAALNGTSDVDWYHYSGSDDFGCVVDPTRSLTAQGTLRLCKYAECLSGSASVDCKNGSTPDTSPQGRSGCCHTAGFGIDLSCPGNDDAAEIYIRLDQGGSACVDYTVNYHY
jgi:hypothetical protein